MFARRELVKGAAALPLATVLANPMLARAAAAGLQEVAITTAGGREVNGALAVPESTPAPAVLLIHEWWGLNDQIKSVAAEFAKEGYLALALDLYEGKVASDPGAASEYMKAVDQEAAQDTVVSWVDWLEAHEQSTGKVGVVGWCFGGGWSLNTAIAAPVDAAVIYYGYVVREDDALRQIEAPILGHFATRDGFVTPESVEAFEAQMQKLGKRPRIHFYEADHAFANPTGARYDQEDAQLAWRRTMAFLEEHLKA